MSKTLPPLPEELKKWMEWFTEDAQSELTQIIQAYAIAAIEAQGVPDGWRPIETAPKDVPVLLYGAKRLEMCVGMNHSRDGWVTETTSELASMYPPTHWMPLPTAPGASAPPAPQAKQPLTDEQMWLLWNAQGTDEMNQKEAIAFARVIEAAHGIKGE